MKSNRIRTCYNFVRMIAILAVFGGLVFNSGCAKVDRMALKPGTKSLNLKKGSICLFSLKTENQYKPDWPPEVYRITIFDESSKKEKLFNVLKGSVIAKGFKDTFTATKGGAEENLINIQLKPGLYRLWAVGGGCAKGVGVAGAMGSFDFPFDIPFKVEEGEYVYMGRIEMINRERVSDDEIPSGGNLGAVGQSLSGFGDGTFDVKISDNYDEDMLRFKEKYPVLAEADIQKRILPPWQKPVR